MRRDRTEWLTKMGMNAALLIALAAAAAFTVTTARADGGLYCECSPTYARVCGEAPECGNCSCMEGGPSNWECEAGDSPGYCIWGSPDEVVCYCNGEDPETGEPIWDEPAVLACWSLTVECEEH